MLRFALLILVGLQLQLQPDRAWAEERSVVVFDGTAVRSMPLPVYVDLLSGKPPLTLLVGLVESMPGSELADLQQQINDLRIAVAKLSAAQPAPPAPVSLVGACGAADACSAAGGCGAAASCGAAAGGCGAAATSGGCGSAGSAGGANYAPFQPLRNFFRSIRSRRGGC